MIMKRLRSRSKLHRRVAGLLALAVALIGAGALYSLVLPAPQTAQANQPDSVAVQQGRQIYNTTCISCHGKNLEGVDGRGPSLVGIGEAAVYFQTETGRMPAVQQGAQMDEKPRVLTPDEIEKLMAFIQSQGGGPTMPEERGEELRGTDPARGGELFRLNCASCHNFTGRGGALSSGKFAPELDGSTEDEIYAAMLSGPESMPRFSERQLTPEEKKDIIAYVKSVTDGNNNPGGNPIGGLGPQSEGLIAFIVGMAALLGITLWIGAKH
ncbi:MAG TPA: cytochrome c [Actinophytocola sp.]|uniref:cytochrome bc1 complex diheme cytochrome c subunit n=1 Tax=Actinophytocola sp. TaxID=1872138 RepID=UPI002DDD3D03|nr:cytochrome c [Actinophytocola sp.]HEV2784055.1 cytochrome c [Actinophytocola sp.]